ncbi:MAG: hypothetical protein FWG05_00595, partial [Kiritimatiellaeota bacterium]|nr:hypothetical protein [Kiritimatiellota bacterium]
MKNRLFYAAMTAVLMTAGATAQSLNTSAFDRTMRISFEGCGVVSGQALAAFPVLIVLDPDKQQNFDYEDFKTPGGGDLRFTGDDGGELNFEIESWNESGSSRVWVQVPELSEDTVITAWWGAELSAPAYAALTWSNGYAAVWHFTENAAPLLDSTGKGNHLTRTSPSNITFGLADPDHGTFLTLSGNGSSAAAYAATADSPSLAQSAHLALEALVFDQSNNTGVRGIISKRKGNNSEVSFNWFKNTGTAQLDIAHVPGASTRFDLMAITQNTWQYIAQIYDGEKSPGTVAQRVSSFRNGVKTLHTATLTSGMYADTASPITIGTLNIGDNRDWNGKFAEARVSNVARSDEWMFASAATLTSPFTFATYSEVLSPNAVDPVVRTLSADVTLSSVTLNGLLFVARAPDATVYTCYGTTDGMTNTQNWDVVIANSGLVDGDPVIDVIPMANLQYCQEYLFRHYADNGVSNAWATA